jgi:hypothetical protein
VQGHAEAVQERVDQRHPERPALLRAGPQPEGHEAAGFHGDVVRRGRTRRPGRHDPHKHRRGERWGQAQRRREHAPPLFRRGRDAVRHGGIHRSHLEAAREAGGQNRRGTAQRQDGQQAEREPQDAVHGRRNRSVDPATSSSLAPDNAARSSAGKSGSRASRQATSASTGRRCNASPPR